MDYETKESLGGISAKVDKALAQADLSPTTQIVFSGDRELYDSAIDDIFAGSCFSNYPCLYCHGTLNLSRSSIHSLLCLQYH